MDVILDTNIYYKDFSLNNNQFDALEAYLKKTNSKLVIPHIVEEELKINFKRLLKKQTKEFYNAAKLLTKCSITAEHNHVLNMLNASNLNNEEVYSQTADQYIEYIKKRFSNVLVLEPLEIQINVLVEKSLKMEKPFSESGTGFKDAIIWESLLKYRERCDQDCVVFITGNSRDFGIKELEENLKVELHNVSFSVSYFNTLRDFILTKFDKISDIDLKLDDINNEELRQKLELYLNSDDSDIDKFLSHKSTSSLTFTNAEGVKSITLDSLNEFYVNDFSDDFKYVTATIICNANIFVGLQAYREFINRATGDLDYEFDHDLDLLNVNLEIVIDLKYNGNEYEELEIFNIVFLS